MTAIRARDVERRFGPTRVLHGVELTVADGEHVTVTGHNGSGKTTLLRILAGLLRADAGDVEILGGSTEDPAVRARLGVIAHAPGLYPRMSAAENIRFWSRLYGRPANGGLELLTTLGLDPSDRRPVASYSQGMQRRAAVARALSTSPELVIADEPFAGLDDGGAAAVARALAAVPTVVLATHERHAPAEGRCVLLREGKLEERPRTEP